MSASNERFLPWSARRIRPSMKQLVELMDEAGGELAREDLRGRVHGGVIPPAKRRGLVVEQDGRLALTPRGRQVADGNVPEIPEEHREVCRCGLVVDRRDKAQMRYLRGHQQGDPETRVCQYAVKPGAGGSP